MDMMRVTARWDGFPGAPGYSNFFFSSGFLDGGLLNDEANLVAQRVLDAFEEIATRLPSSVTIRIEPEVPVIDSDTGMIQSFGLADVDETVEGQFGENFAGPAGAVITWRTNDLRNGRRIRGRTFIVPLATQNFEDDGTLTDTAITPLRAFADTLMGGGLDADLGIWSRPSGGSGGVFATVQNYTIPDMVAVLRSRRD